MSTPIWSPSEKTIEESNLSRFVEYVQEKCCLELPSFSALFGWSVEQPEQFWKAVWEFCGIKASVPCRSVLQNGESMLGAKWFDGAELNFAENLLQHRSDEAAIVFSGENSIQRSLSFNELYNSVSCLSRYLKSLGVTKGDRVVGFMPNIPETIVAMLAASSLGAVWSSCSPDFGIKGVMDRFGQIAPKVLFTAEAYSYNGKNIDCLERVAEIAGKLSTLEAIVVVPHMEPQPETNLLPTAALYQDCLAEGAKSEEEFSFVQLPFDHPLYIMYSSGTTGVPKCIVHGAGGTLIQHLKEHVLHSNVKPGDRLFYFTTCGWMMWNWLVTGLASRATLLLFDGSPFYPDGNILFEFAEKERMNHFGTSAKYITALEKAGLTPGDSYDLSALRLMLSTGSPLVEENYDYVYSKIKNDMQLASISGGTDLISCFALGNPVAPVYRGELQTRGLGMSVDVFDDEGESLRGRPGELVCTKPFPSMPIYFYNDPDNAKYKSSYFEDYDNVWRHGDWVELTPNDGMVIYGRSDATLNPSGVRIGTAEIYQQVEALEEVSESIVVGQNWDDDERVVLFVKLAEGISLDDELRKKIKTTIRKNTSPRHVPAKIIQVEGIPRTISGKIVELAVKNILHGRPVKNKDALANPETLEYFKDLEELKQ